MGVLLNYVPYVLSCPTYLVTHVLLCPTDLVPYAPSCSTLSNVSHASCPTCSRRLSASCPTCSCVSLASRATCYRVLGALCPKCSRASRASGLMCFLSYVPRSKRPLVSHVCYVYCTSLVLCLACSRALVPRTLHALLLLVLTYFRCFKPNILLSISCLVAFMPCVSCAFAALAV